MTRHELFAPHDRRRVFRRSRIARGLSGPLYYTFFIATFLGIYESLLASHVIPYDLPCAPICS